MSENRRRTVQSAEPHQNRRSATQRQENTSIYWVIKCDAGYWLEEGGCTPKQRKAEVFTTRKKASDDKRKWLHPGEKAWLVRVVPENCKELYALYNRVMVENVIFDKKLRYTVRLWDGMDGCWCDVAKNVSAIEALLSWSYSTNGGTKNTNFGEIDYYRIFPADTRMAWDGSKGKEMFRGHDGR